ncbi:MAG: hypothetical protein K0S90_1414 [Enterobacteriaceae bacterium]|jgi:hypothetical protein|nr:hypothetical protein [Enterobacteriaceae bacterium]
MPQYKIIYCFSLGLVRMRADSRKEKLQTG